MVPAKTMRKFIYIVSEEIHLWINIMRGNWQIIICTAKFFIYKIQSMKNYIYISKRHNIIMFDFLNYFQKIYGLWCYKSKVTNVNRIKK
jgi:hypothetical protein